MADTKLNIIVNSGVWVDLYAKSGFPIGTQITVENIGDCDVHLAIQAIKPERDHDSYNLLSRSGDGILTNTEGDVGAWAYCNNSDGKINVVRTKSIAGFYPLAASDFNNGLGSGIKVDATGTQRVALDFSVFRSYFTFDIPPSLWSIDEDGVEVRNDLSTRVTSLTGHANIRSGAVAGNKASLTSRRHPRYQPNRGLRLSGSAGFKGANLDGILKFGLFVVDENGAYFKTKGDGKLYAVILKDGIETNEEEITFPFAVNITLGNIYTVQILWHGVGAVRYYVDNPATGFPQLVHTINFLNQLDQDLFFHNPALNVAYTAENITQEVSLWTGSVDVSAEGGQRDSLQYGSNSARVTRTASTNNGILAMRSPELINGKSNTRDMRLVRITLQTDKKCDIKLYRTRDQAAIVAGAWSASVFGSFVEFNSTMTSVNLSLMDDFLTIDMPANVLRDLNNPDKDIIDFIIVHGDVIVIALDTGSAVNVTATIEYGEEI